MTTANAAPESLPTNDSDRLLFYSEVVIANIPSLIADLSSPKYTFLSFSERTRNEVKQKSALIQSISRTFNNVLATQKQLEEKERKLETYEVELVTATPPKFMSAEEVLAEKANGQADEGASSNASTVMILNEQDIQPVREAEGENTKETETYTELCRTAEEMETQFAAARVKCEEMTKHVQSLKTKYDALHNSLKRTQHERKLIAIAKEEFEERQVIYHDAVSLLQAMETQCRNEELDIIQQSIKRAQDEVDQMRHELLQRKEKHEVELAAYQIAFKEAQAEVESLKDDTAFLKKHQADLETLAKRQQTEESSQNSLKKFLMKSVSWSASKSDSANKPLSAEQLAEVKNDHALVALLAANIFAMDEQRKSVAGILAQVPNAYDSDAVRSALHRIQGVLEPAIVLDEAALEG